MVLRLFVTLVWCALVTPAASQETAGRTITLSLGMIAERAERPDYMIARYQPLIERWQSLLGDSDVVLELVVARDREELTRLVRSGAVQLVLESLFTQLRLGCFGMRPWMVAWRKGKREVRTLFFVREDSDIQTLEDLRGRGIVFESPRSTSAYALPRGYLHSLGLPTLAMAEGAADGSAIRFGFAGDERTQAYWVALGRFDAGAFNDDDWQRLPDALAGRLRTIASTPSFLRWLLSIHDSVESPLREALAEALLALNHDDGEEALSGAEIERIEPLGERDLQSIDTARRILRFMDAPPPQSATAP